MHHPSPIPCQRHLFDIPELITYLNCAYMSPLLHRVREAGQQAVARKSQPWQIQPVDFFTETEQVRKRVAQVIEATEEDIAIIPAVSYGLAVAAHNLRVQPGGRILVLDEQFPSNIYAWWELAQAKELEIVTVRRPENEDWTTAVLAALDERVTLTALPHCHWTDGSRLDLERIGEHCRQVGSALVLDVTQSLGAVPLNISRIRPDFLACAFYKWLLGPYSLGFLYVDPRYQEGRPVEQGWIARRGSENFARLVDYQTAYQPGARRFDVGERSNFTLMPMVKTALDQILEWKVERIEASLRRLTQQIGERARDMGLTTTPDHLRAGHMLGIRFPQGLPEGLGDRLTRAGIYVSFRGSSMRVSPHLYNSEVDVERLFDELVRTDPDRLQSPHY